MSQPYSCFIRSSCLVCSSFIAITCALISFSLPHLAMLTATPVRSTTAATLFQLIPLASALAILTAFLRLALPRLLTLLPSFLLLLFSHSSIYVILAVPLVVPDL